MHWKRLLHHLLTSHHPNLLSSRTELEGWCIISEAFSDQDTTQRVTYCQIACSRYSVHFTLLLSLHGLFFSALPCSVGLALVSYPIHRGLSCPPSTRPPASSWWRRRSPCYTREMVAARLGGGYCHQLCGPGHSPRPGHGCPRCLVTHHHQPGHPALATPIISIIIITTGP